MESQDGLDIGPRATPEVAAWVHRVPSSTDAHLLDIGSAALEQYEGPEDLFGYLGSQDILNFGICDIDYNIGTAFHAS